jgi:hypothetical protein
MTTTLWTHGNAAQVQQPTELTDVAYTGKGLKATIKAGKNAWIHIPIPSPDTNLVPRLTNIYLDFFITDGRLDELSVYDGATRIHHETDTYLTDYVDIELGSPHDVKEGIGLSVHFVYGGDPSIDNLPQTIELWSAAGVYNYKIVATKSANPSPIDNEPIKSKP